MDRTSSVPWRSFLYTSHLCSAWGERMWEFSAGLLLLDLGGGRSLLLPAVLACGMLFTQLALGGKIGRAVDHGHAVRTPLLALLAQNCFIASAAVSAVVSLRWTDAASIRAGVCIIIFFSCASRVAAVGSCLSVQNHWAKALSAGDRDTLAELNGQMRRIDLTCKIVAPMASGALMSVYSPGTAALAVALVNLLAWPVEASCLLRVYRDAGCKTLLNATKKDKRPGAATGAAPPALGLAFYFSQGNIWPSTFALSMLHLTVLSFGQLMTAYVMTLGISAAAVASYRSIGEVFGFTATILAPRAVKRIGPARSATVFIWCQLAMLIPCAIGASGWARVNLQPFVSSMLLVGGVGVSRLGLWGFDLSVTQLMQERVEPPSALASYAGVQKSFEAFFGTTAALCGVVLSDPLQFQYLAYGSWVAVFSAGCLHSFAAAFWYRDSQDPHHVSLLAKT